MKINDKIIETLRELKIPPDDGVPYLLALYYEFKPSYIPAKLKQKVNATGIVKSDGTKGLKWDIPLFEGGKTNFDWVKTEFVQMFKDANPEKRGNGSYAMARMKRLFTEHPEIRKDEVIGAARMYIASTDSKYLRFSHYFIEKGKGKDKIQDILEWIDKYRLIYVNDTKGDTTFTQMQ